MKTLKPIKTYHKRIILLFYFFSILPLGLIGQDSIVITEASNVKLINETALFIDGSIINEDGSILNSGDIFLKGNIVNNDSDSLFLNTTVPGVIRFIGDSIQRISGNPIFLYKVIIQNTDSTLILGTNVGIKDTIVFENGIIDLNGYNVQLENYDNSNYGTLGKESDTSRITGDSGYVYSGNMSFSNFISRNGAGMGLHITGSPTGDVNVERGHSSQITVTDGSIKKYYNVFAGTTGQDVGVEVYYIDSTDFWDINCTEDDFKIFTSYTQGYYFENKYGNVDVEGDFAFETPTDILLNNDIRITVADHICDNPPIVNIDDTLNICAGSSEYIDAENIGNYFYWSTGQTTHSISVYDPGWYYVTVTDPYRCFTIDSILVQHDSIPHPSFTTASGFDYNCVGENFNFINNTTSDPSTLPLSFLWEFGDGTSSTEINPQKAFLASGVYTVTLTSYTIKGCQSYSTKDVTVNPLPNVSFTALNACDYNPVIFTNTTTNTNSCVWIFGDGTNSTCNYPDIDASHQYENYGSYTVQLNVTSSMGCIDSLSQIVNVYPAPVADFSIEDADICLQEASVFHNSSTSEDGALTYHWNFGNGQANSTPNPIITYVNSGDYDVSLLVESQHECFDSITKTISIDPLPQTDFTFNDVCFGDTVNFQNISNVSSGETLSFVWNFGDGNTSTDINSSHIYNTEGTYTVILNATSESGCVGNIQKDVTIYPIPSVNFVCHNVCQGEASSFENYSTCGSENLNYEWNFGDGNTSNQTSPDNYYISDGIFATSLIAISDFGCSDTLHKNIEVYPTPTVNIGDEINHCFDSYEIDAGNPGCSYHWSNNNTSQTITVNSDGEYSVTVTNSNSCSNSDTVDIYLSVPITIDFGGDYLETCDSIVLNTGYPNAETLWSDGSSDPTLTIFESGTYSVSITDQNCPGDTSVYIEVYNSPEIELGSDITVCEGETVVLNPEIIVPNYIWSTDEITQQISVTNDGQYSVTVSDSHGCTASDVVNVEFNPLPILPFGSDTIVCGALMLNAQNEGSQYLWNDLSTNQTLTANESGEYWVNITAGNNCSLSDTISVTVYPVPEIDLGNDTSLCVGDIFEISAGEGFESYLWSNSSESQNIFAVETGEYWVNVGNEYNCFSSDTLNIVFHNNPLLNLDSDLYLCSNQTGILDAGDDGTNYIWESSNDFESNEQTVMVTDSGMYWVEVINNFGCSSRDSIYLHYSDNSINANFLAASEVQRGDSVRFVDVSYPTPISYMWKFGDGAITNDSLPTHVYYLEGDFKVTLTASTSLCTDTASKYITVIGTSNKFIPENVDIAPTNDLIEIISASLYPNPTEDICYYELQLNRHTLIILDLYSMNSQLLYSEHIKDASYIHKEINMQNLMPGMYILRMRYSNKTKTYKIIKK